jgi:hypothetical protein
MSPTDRASWSLADRLAILPKYYRYADVLDLCFDNDEDAFVDAWIGRHLPAPVQRACLETLDPPTLQNMLLCRLIRQNAEILAALHEGTVSVFEDPTPTGKDR